MRFTIQATPRSKLRLDIAICSLVALTFILIIARVANKGTPSTRANTWGIAVCLKSAVSLAYQMVTGHVDRFKRWGSTKANKILTIIDTVFWFALFIISILGTSSSHSTSSRALGVIVILLALVLCAIDCVQSYICIRIRKHFKQYGVLPEETAMKSSGSV
ncbi:uncharacterized protein N7496_000547 [Penicillium cataractarum]|uniref:Uncharacterized protein n=1 Tax=Penicillium cataractarum TaxID=2100454 RepID=A0A9X0B614_9EURO|nr:uncharacterized protein N7496_000547 [Penicillium cataractarum]KAJ5389479.1 hypothetical protein N7496_000547 [Penicillium cataractarum]